MGQQKRIRTLCLFTQDISINHSHTHTHTPYRTVPESKPQPTAHNHRRVTRAEGAALASKLRIGFIETSALDNCNVQSAFEMIARQLLLETKGREVRSGGGRTSTIDRRSSRFLHNSEGAHHAHLRHRGTTDGRSDTIDEQQQHTPQITQFGSNGIRLDKAVKPVGRKKKCC